MLVSDLKELLKVDFHFILVSRPFRQAISSEQPTASLKCPSNAQNRKNLAADQPRFIPFEVDNHKFFINAMALKHFSGRYDRSLYDPDEYKLWRRYKSTSAEAFREFTNFFQWKEVTVTLKNAIELLDLALHFEMHRSQIQCIAGFIIAWMDESDVLKAVNIADEYDYKHITYNGAEKILRQKNTYEFQRRTFQLTELPTSIKRTDFDTNNHLIFSLNAAALLISVEFAALNIGRECWIHFQLYEVRSSNSLLKNEEYIPAANIDGTGKIKSTLRKAITIEPGCRYKMVVFPVSRLSRSEFQYDPETIADCMFYPPDENNDIDGFQITYDGPRTRQNGEERIHTIFSKLHFYQF